MERKSESLRAPSCVTRDDLGVHDSTDFEQTRHYMGSLGTDHYFLMGGGGEKKNFLLQKVFFFKEMRLCNNFFPKAPSCKHYVYRACKQFILSFQALQTFFFSIFGLSLTGRLP